MSPRQWRVAKQTEQRLMIIHELLNECLKDMRAVGPLYERLPATNINGGPVVAGANFEIVNLEKSIVYLSQQIYTLIHEPVPNTQPIQRTTPYV